MKRDIDKFHLMKVFQAVATAGSFTKGADELGMTPSSVSKAVQQLEGILQARLLHRTTRSQSLTDPGKDYLITAQKLLGDVKELEDRILQQGDEPSGLLRVAAPTAIGQFLIGPRLPQFLAAFPQIRIELILSENLVNMTDEGFDVAIRSLNVADNSSLYSIKLGAHTRKLVASPEYTAQRSAPERPEHLAEMSLLTYSGIQAAAQWRFSNDGEEVAVEPVPVYSSNNYYAIHQAALGGVGVANLYQYLVDDDIGEGKLIHLMPQWKQHDRDLFAIYQQRRDTSPKLDKFLAFLNGLFD